MERKWIPELTFLHVFFEKVILRKSHSYVGKTEVFEDSGSKKLTFFLKRSDEKSFQKRCENQRRTSDAKNMQFMQKWIKHGSGIRLQSRTIRKKGMRKLMQQIDAEKSHRRNQKLAGRIDFRHPWGQAGGKGVSKY